MILSVLDSLKQLVQVMSLIAYLMEFKGNYGPHLIIVPNAVLVNWKVRVLFLLYMRDLLSRFSGGCNWVFLAE